MFPNTSPSAYLVEINNKRILIDAGIGTLRQLGKIKISPEDIDIILITHWHIDHYAGLPKVLRAKKSKPLSVYGPPLPVFARIYMTLTLSPLKTNYETITDSFSRTYADFNLKTIPNSHNADSYGWVISDNFSNISAGKRIIVISGDTRPTQNVLNAARGADLLVHEATYMGKDAQKAHLHYHTTSTEAAEIALKAGVGALALTHISRKSSRLELQNEANKIFPGVIVPLPLDTLYLENILDEDLRKNVGRAKIRIMHGTGGAE
jgi:ribonuclease Z